MHALVHIGIRIAFIALISIVFTLFVAKRPGAQKRPSTRGFVGLLVVGALIGVVFLVSGNLYVTPNY